MSVRPYVEFGLRKCAKMFTREFFQFGSEEMSEFRIYQGREVGGRQIVPGRLVYFVGAPLAAYFSLSAKTFFGRRRGCLFNVGGGGMDRGEDAAMGSRGRGGRGVRNFLREVLGADEATKNRERRGRWGGLTQNPRNFKGAAHVRLPPSFKAFRACMERHHAPIRL